MTRIVLALALLLTACAKPLPPAPAPEVPPEVIEAVIAVESGGNHRAVSRTGCIGLMQLAPGTAKMLGYSRQDLFDPELNRQAGTRYLELMLELFDGDLEKALAAYNCGPGRWKHCKAYARKVMGLL